LENRPIDQLKSIKIYRTTPNIVRSNLRIPKKTPSALTITLVVGALILSNTLEAVQAQTIAFTPADKFIDPSQNSTISFAINGTYSSANLENDTWTFNDLMFDDPALPYFDLSGIKSIGNLSIAAHDCNVTVWIYLKAMYSYPIAIISYLVEGTGTQTVNLGLENSTDVSEWSVIDQNSVFIAEGQGWVLLPDDSLIITPSSEGNYTVMHFDFNDPDAQRLLPFWMQHSVLLLMGIVLVAIVLVAVFIRKHSPLGARRNSGIENQMATLNP
jgi:hypothetical protein